MNKSLLFIVALIIGAVSGYFAGRTSNGKDLTYDFEDCIKKCDTLPQLDDLRRERDICKANVPGPNVTVCQHVPPDNRAACMERVYGEYNEKIKPCMDAYERGLDKLNDCTRDCDRLIIDKNAQKTRSN